MSVLHRPRGEATRPAALLAPARGIQARSPGTRAGRAAIPRERRAGTCASALLADVQREAAARGANSTPSAGNARRACLGVRARRLDRAGRRGLVVLPRPPPRE